MYCKNCGHAMDPNAAFCVNCGCAKGVGTAYCPNCGQATMPNAAVCTACGCALGAAPAASGAKSKLVAGLLAIFLGSLGIHNFYLGNTKRAVIQLVITLVGSCIAVGPIVSGIWALIEGIQILCGKITTDGKGMPLAD